MRQSKLWRRGVKLVQRLHGVVWSGMTLGVSVIAVDEAGRVFLVRPSYVPGFHLPGGGVERGETAEQAARREIFEEGRLVSAQPLELVGFFHNPRHSIRNHVVLYLLRGARQTEARPRDFEIVENGFFPLDALPPQASLATRARLAEVFQGQTPSPTW